MKRTISVFLGDANRRVGTLRFDSQGTRQIAAFEYDREWLAAKDRFALAPNLPLVAGAQFHKPPSREASIFHGVIADTEPDGWARRVILRDHARRRAVSRDAGQAQDSRPLTPIDFLLAVDARAAGINVPQASLVSSDGVPVAVIRRFDRTPKGRLMYASAATLLGVEAGEPGEHTYTEIVDAIRQHGADAQAEIEELWRRIAFSILINNVDDHRRNHGFLHVARGQWRLSPAFDVNPFPDRQRELRTWISENAGPAASIDALMAVAPYFQLDKDDAIKIVADVERAVSAWRAKGRDLGMSKAELDQFADAFEHRERTVARSIS